MKDTNARNHEQPQTDPSVAENEVADVAVPIQNVALSEDNKEQSTEVAEAAADTLTLSSAAVESGAATKTNGKHKKIKLTKADAVHMTKYFALLAAMACARSLIAYIFIIPNGFAPGGLSGISSILYNAILPSNPQLAKTVFDPGITMFVMNIPFIIVSFFVLNKKFAFNTFIVISIYSLLMYLLGLIDGFPQFVANDDTGLKIIAAVAGGAVTGVCLGIMLRNNMSMGGTDIIGKIIHKHKPGTGAQWWILACDCTVAMCSGIVGVIQLDFANVTPSDALTTILSPIFFSYVSLFVGSIVTDVMQSGFQSSIVFNIITDKSDEISKAITERLHRGVTMSTAVGYYTKIEHKVLTCVVSKRQIVTVKKIISETDPLAFTYITKAHEVAGKGFHSAG